MSANDVLLTGPPRSGTTLAAELLSRLPNTVALDEPMEIAVRPESEAATPPDPRATCDEIERQLATIRSSILATKKAFTAHVEGEVFGAKFADDGDGGGLRKALYTRGEITIDKPLTPDFLLITKHPAAFTALVDVLIERFRVYALVRNPLSILSSWQTVPFTVREGHHQAAERIDYELAGTLARTEDRIDRQFHLLGWFFGRLSALPESNIIRYESLVSSGGRALGAITAAAASLDEHLENRNAAPVYDRRDMLMLGERLLESDAPYWRFYSRESVRELMERAAAGAGG